MMHDEQELSAFREHYGRDPIDADEFEFWTLSPPELRKFFATKTDVTEQDVDLAKAMLGRIP